MPYFYNVEKKIGANIVILTLIGIISFSVCIYLFISNYIQKKRLKSIYDYMLVKDYDNASFVFKDMQIFRIHIVRPSGVHPGGLCHK